MSVIQDALGPSVTCPARPSPGAPTAATSASVKPTLLLSATLRVVYVNVNQATWALTVQRRAQLAAGVPGVCMNVSVPVVPHATLPMVSVSKTVHRASPDLTVSHRVSWATMVLGV